MPEHKFSWKDLKTFTLEYSNDDLRLTLSFYGKVKFSGLFYRKSSWPLKKIWCKR